AEGQGRGRRDEGGEEGWGPGRRERDQPAALAGCPLLECPHQRPAGAAATILAADKNLLDPGHWAVGVEGQVLKAEEVAQALLSVHRQQQAGAICGEQGWVAEVEPGPGEGERLRQLGGQVCDRIGVTGTGRSDLAPCIVHCRIISGVHLTKRSARPGRPHAYKKAQQSRTSAATGARLGVPPPAVARGAAVTGRAMV